LEEVYISDLDSINRKHFVVRCTIENNGRQVNTYAMEDSGGTAEAFIDETFARKYNYKLQELSSPLTLRVVDGRPSSAGAITHTVDITLRLGDHIESITAHVTKIDRYNFILGAPWLEKHNPYIDWAQKTQTFHSNHCKENCLPKQYHQYSINAVGHIPSSTGNIVDNDQESQPLGGRPRRLNAASFDTFSRMEQVEVFSASLYEVNQRLKAVGEKVEERHITPYSPPTKPPRKRPSSWAEANDMDLCQMELELKTCDKYKAEKEDLKQKQRGAAELYLNGASLEDIQIALKPKIHADPAIKVPEWLRDYLKVFDQREPDVLPPHRDDDHSIELQPGKTPPAGPLYSMSRDELLVLKKWLEENLSKGFIRTSTSPAAAPVLFAKKPGGGLRFCVDYRGLNAITIRNRYPLPLVQETLARLSKARFYTKLDIVAAFNNLRIKEGQEWMTAFNTRYGLFESLVMPFGLTNAPATFQTYINKLLHPFLDVFCTAYIDDILIYSDDFTSHKTHVKRVLAVLQDAGLKCDIKKCEFAAQEVCYLGMIISTNGVMMDPKKVECIKDWEAPSCVKDVQAFLGFANFYRRFIKGFSTVAKPLVNLTKKDTPFKWTDRCNDAFESLKLAFVSAPVLGHFDPDLEIFVEADASDFVSAGVISQKGKDGVRRPIAYMSKKHNPAECNYEIYDKELMAIVRCFEEWRAELQGSAHPITVITDHRNLEYFMTTKALTRRQVRWSEFLSQFDFKISWKPGKLNANADALTRRSQDQPANDDDERQLYRHQTLLKPHNLPSELLGRDPKRAQWTDEVEASPAALDEEIPDESITAKIERLLENGYVSDAFWKRIEKELTKTDGVPHSKEISLSECTIRNGRLYFRDRVYVPDNSLRTFLIQTAHDSTESGHPGKNRLYELLSRDYFWPRLSADIKTFCKACHGCIRNKNSKLRYQGALKPLPLPAQRWRDISVDFMGPFEPGPSGNDMIMVVVDRLTKEKHFSACKATMTAADLAKLFLRDVWKLHGLPDTIVSDRGALFIAEFWAAVCHRLKVTANLSTAFHPESDGQTEISNATLLQYLRFYVNYTQDDWEEWLPLAEFALNNAVSASTGMSPFFANKGYHPRVSFGPLRPIPADASKSVAEKIKQGNEFTRKMEDILDALRTNLITAQIQQQEQADRNRTPAPAYRPGDMVFLSTENLTTDRPTPKLDSQFVGPLEIEKVIGTHAYRLRLPYEMGKVHRTFHTNLLRPAPDKSLPGQTQQKAPPISIDAEGEKLWAIEAILDSKREKGTFKYLIHWRGYDASEQTWEPLHNVINAYKSIREYEKLFPKKPRPTAKEIKMAKEW
jgi:hypothetical protein